MTSLLHHITSLWGSSHFEWVIQSAAFPPRHTHTHAHELQNIPRIPHSSSSFWRGNISDILVALCSGIHFVSAFLTSVLTVSGIVSLIPHILYFCVCMPQIIGLLIFSDDNLVIQRHISGAWGEGLLRWVGVAECARFTYGGYLLCGNTDLLQDACSILPHISAICQKGEF